MSEEKKIWLVYAMGQEDPLWACLSEADAQMHAENERADRTTFVFVESIPISGAPEDATT